MLYERAPGERAGIYAIINTKNGRIYFGSTADFPDRYRRHYYGLRQGRHTNSSLQADWDLQGGEGFVFSELLSTRNADRAKEMETRLFADCVGKDWCYNIADQQAVTFRGRKHTPETLDKLRIKALAREARKRGTSST